MNPLPDPETTCEISVRQVSEQSQAIASGDLVLIDCRENDEWHIARLPNAILLPLSGFLEKVEALEDQRHKPWVVYCHHGMRSMQVVTWLRARGQAQTWSMQGGIAYWSRDIDPSIPTY